MGATSESQAAPLPAAGSSFRSAGIAPAPTEEEAAAIMAAVEALWPKPVVQSVAEPKPSAWRFSGRWWSRPVPVRRDRPFI